MTASLAVESLRHALEERAGQVHTANDTRESQ
jgi:hypothetical protein